MNSDVEPVEPDEFFAVPGLEVARFGRHIVMSTAAASTDERALMLDFFRERREEVLEARARLGGELRTALRTGEGASAALTAAIMMQMTNYESFVESDYSPPVAVAQYVVLLAAGLGGEFGDGTDPQLAERVAQLGIELFELEQMYLVTQEIPAADEDPSREEALVKSLGSKAQLQQMVVRGRAYAHHERETLRGLFGGIDHLCRAHVGCTIDEALRVVDAVYDCVTERLREAQLSAWNLTKGLRKQVSRARRKPNIEVPDLVRNLASLKPKVAHLAVSQIGLALALAEPVRLLAVTLEEVSEMTGLDNEVVKAVLDLLTFDPGDFSEQHHSLPPLTSPLVDHPIIRSGDAYLGVFVGSLLEALRPAFDQRLVAGAAEDYTNHRGRYLEVESTRLLVEALGGRHTFLGTNIEWTSTDGSVASEIDGLIGIDTVTLAIQAKAGGIRAAALRGAPSSLRDDLADLIGAAEHQHQAMFRAISSGIRTTVDAKASLKAPLVLPVTVLLEDIGSLTAVAAQTSALLQQQTPSAPVVSLNDLRILTDLLRGPELLHYLSRRVRLNRLGAVSVAEEMDWVGHYIAEGLYFSELEGDDGPQEIQLLSYTDDLDAYFYGEQGLRSPTRMPRQFMPATYAWVIGRVWGNGYPGFATACMAFLEISDEARAELAAHIVELRGRAAKRGVASVTMHFQSFGLTVMVAADPDGWNLTAHAASKLEETGFLLWVTVVLAGVGVSEIHVAGDVKAFHQRMLAPFGQATSSG